MVIILILEFELIEFLNQFLNNIFKLFDLFIKLIINYYLINYFFTELDHQHGIFIRPLIQKLNTVKVDCLIENDIFYFSPCFASEISKFIIVKEKELKFNSIIFHEFYIICPVDVLFTIDFYHRRICFNITTISYHNESISHKNIIIFFLTD